MSSRWFYPLAGFCLGLSILCGSGLGCMGKQSAKKAEAPPQKKAAARPGGAKEAGAKTKQPAARPSPADERAKGLAGGETGKERAIASYAVADTAQRAGAIDDLLLTPEPYYYESLGRRDLFKSLVSEEASAEEVSARPVSGGLRVVGILWAERDRFALVEAPDGRNMILREGDSTGDGTVAQVLPDRILIHVTQYGTSRNVTLPLVEGGGFDESPRSRSR